MPIDPVCGMEVAPETAAAKSVHEGVTYYFCSTECKEIFDRAPKEVLRASKAHNQS
jgi:YHS domain-containing protein